MGSAVNPVKSIIADVIKLSARQDTITHFPLRLCVPTAALSHCSRPVRVYTRVDNPTGGTEGIYTRLYQEGEGVADS